MLYNPTVAMLKNEATGKWHPIIFEEHVMGGCPSPNKPMRQKSMGHHTEGFDSREDAVTEAKTIAKKAKIGRIQIDEDLPWDGKDTPAMVGFVSDDKLIFI